MNQSRRQFLKATLAAAVVGVVISAGMPSAWAQETFDPAELAVPSPLGDISYGSEEAPITMIEYSSLTCGHCATFKTTVFPEIKAKYIDTGKVHYIVREFPLDAVATAGFMMGRALPADRYPEFLQFMYETQKDWAFTDNPYEALQKIGQQVGLSKEKLDAAITDQTVLDALTETRDRGNKEFNITGTPSFFVNGEKVVGYRGMEEWEKIFQQYL